MNRYKTQSGREVDIESLVKDCGEVQIQEAYYRDDDTLISEKDRHYLEDKYSLELHYDYTEGRRMSRLEDRYPPE